MRLGRRCHGLLPTPQKAGPAPREGLNLSGRLQCTVRGWRGIRGLHVGCELGQVAVSVLQSFVAFVRQKACRPQHFLLVKRFDPMIRCAAVKPRFFLTAQVTPRRKKRLLFCGLSPYSTMRFPKVRLGTDFFFLKFRCGSVRCVFFLNRAYAVVRCGMFSLFYSSFEELIRSYCCAVRCGFC